MLCFKLYGYHRDLHVLTHSFPARRSSDLPVLIEHSVSVGGAVRRPGAYPVAGAISAAALISASDGVVANVRGATLDRSEEDTSELQSLMRISYAVFCLKKKIQYTPLCLTEAIACNYTYIQLRT